MGCLYFIANVSCICPYLDFLTSFPSLCNPHFYSLVFRLLDAVAIENPATASILVTRHDYSIVSPDYYMTGSSLRTL